MTDLKYTMHRWNDIGKTNHGDVYHIIQITMYNGYSVIKVVKCKHIQEYIAKICTSSIKKVEIVVKLISSLPILELVKHSMYEIYGVNKDRVKLGALDDLIDNTYINSDALANDIGLLLYHNPLVRIISAKLPMNEPLSYSRTHMDESKGEGSFIDNLPSYLKPSQLVAEMELETNIHCFEKLAKFQDDNPDLIKMSGRDLVHSYMSKHTTGSFRTRNQDQLIELAMLPVINKSIVLFRGHEQKALKYFDKGISTSLLIATAKGFGEIIYVINVPAGSTVIPSYTISEFECEITLFPGSRFEIRHEHETGIFDDDEEYVLIYVDYIEPEWLTELKQTDILDHDRRKSTFPEVEPVDWRLRL